MILYILISFKDRIIFSQNRAHQDLNCLEKWAHVLINLDYFATIGIDELLYPYAVSPDLFSPKIRIFYSLKKCHWHLENSVLMHYRALHRTNYVRVRVRIRPWVFTTYCSSKCSETKIYDQFLLKVLKS